MVARLVSLEFALLCSKFCMGSTVGKNHRFVWKTKYVQLYDGWCV